MTKPTLTERIEYMATWEYDQPHFIGGQRFSSRETLREALRLLAAEDERQSKLHELLETIREQIRLGVPPEHRPEGLFKNIQDAVYAMRGRTPLMNDAAIIGGLVSPAKDSGGKTPGDPGA